MEIQDRFDLIRVVGKGSFGTVHKAIDRNTGQTVALKELNPPCSPSEYLPEIRALTDLEHPRIVSLKQVVYTEDESVFLVFEYMKCSLRGFIQQRELNGMPFSEAEIRSMALQVFQGLDLMHRQRGYMHRDLKPENLLVNERKEVKISDLGSAIEIDPRGNMFDHHVTTLCYEAPEMLLETSYDEKVDMWAAGLILVDMFLMFPLYRGNDQLYMMRQVLGAPDCNSKIGRMVAEALVNKPEREEEKGGVGFRAILPDASESAIDLIQSLCSWEPSKRPSAAEALRHPFFTSANNVAAAPAFSCCAVPKTTSLSYMQPIC